MSDYTLPVKQATTVDYPKRCTGCARPVHWLAVFPGGRCIDCHAAVTPPVTDARELARMWGGR